MIVGGEPTVVGALIGVIGAIVAGLLGGYFGWKGAVTAVERAHRQNLDRDSRQRAQTIKAVLLAIRAEVESVWDAYDANLGPAIRTLPAGQSLTGC